MARYEQSKRQNVRSRVGSIVLDYGSEFAEGAVAESGISAIAGPEGSPMIGGVAKVLVHGMKEYGKSLEQSYNEAVKVQLLVEADKQLSGSLIDKHTGHVNVGALEKNGSLSWLTDPEFYQKVDPNHREALEYARGNVQIDMLRSEAAQLTITQQEIQGNSNQLVKIYGAVRKTDSFASKISDLVTSEHDSLERFAEDSRQSASELRTILASNLPPRQKLALVNRGLIEVAATERRKLQDTVAAQDFVQLGDDTSSLLSAAAGALGTHNPKLANNLRQLAQIAKIGAGICAAYLTDNVVPGMTTGTLNLIGAISSFGAPPPSPESQMLKEVLQKLDEIEHKIDVYHAEEMQALKSIDDDLRWMHTDLLSQFSVLQMEVFYSLQAIRELASDKVQPCDRGSEAFEKQFHGLEQWSFDQFQEWLTPEHAHYYYSSCVEGLSKEWQPWKSQIPMLLIPLTTFGETADANAEAELSRAHQTLQTLMVPTIAYLNKYNLWTPALRTYFREPIDTWVKLSAVSQNPAPPLGHAFQSSDPRSHLAIDAGGSSLIDPWTVLELSKETRTILNWTPMMWVDNAGVRVATKSEIQSCAKRREQCRFADPNNTDAIGLLQNDEKILRWLIEQEQLIAGLPGVVFAANVLNKSVISQYNDARSGASDGAKLQKLLTAPTACATSPCLKPTQYVSSMANCSGANTSPERDTLCMMQVNPLFADNVISYLVWQRMEQRGTFNQYRGGLVWDNSSILASAIGSDIRVYDASTAPAPAGPPLEERRQWAVELPRVFTQAVDSGTGELSVREQDSIPPQSCWYERDRDLKKSPEMDWFLDELRVGNANAVGDSRWARCYMLPSPKAVESQEISKRAGFAQIEDELKEVALLVSDLTPQTSNAALSSAGSH